MLVGGRVHFAMRRWTAFAWGSLLTLGTTQVMGVMILPRVAFLARNKWLPVMSSAPIDAE